jgi:methyl-accepting chemotaxis protein
MTECPAPADDVAAEPPTAPTWRQRLAPGGMWLIAAAGIAMAWSGAGLLGVGGALLAALGAAAATSRRTAWSSSARISSDAGDSSAGNAAGTGGRHGAEVMVSQVAPVWSRQLEVTRDVASDGLAQILANFSEMSDALRTLSSNLDTFSLAAAPGAVDGAVRSESPALAALLAPSERAFKERDAAYAELSRCGTALAELQQLSKRARELARHTRLVAMNASIEANRGASGQTGGTHAVASEVRELSTRLGDTASAMEKIVLTLVESIGERRRDGAVNDTTPEELRLELDLRAREALAALMGAMGTSVQGSDDVRQASAALRDQLDEAFVHFQFGDRVSQMLSIVGNDMTNFARWVAHNPTATQSDAAEWLAALESSYTMDEQRSHHHGNVHVERSSGVEFF